MKLKVGIIGFGRIGREHANWISACDNLQVGAVFDPTPACADIARSRGFPTVISLDALLDDSSIDVALVSTPTSFHHEHALAAIRAGKHVMIEKPMALDAKQARQIQAEALAGKRVVSVFHNRRWDADFLTVRQAITDGLFGRVFNIESRLGQWASCVGPAAREYRPTWRNERAFGGGGWFDWGSHFVDQLWQLFTPAKPVHVFAQLRGNIWSQDCDDLARVNISFDNGAIGLVEINTTTTCPLPRWHIDGSAGSAESPHSPEFDTHRWSQLTLLPAPKGAAVQIARAQCEINEIQIWRHFGNSVVTGARPLIDLDSVINTMTLLDAARQSSETGQVLQIASFQ